MFAGLQMSGERQQGMKTDWKDLGSGVGLEGAHRYGIVHHSEEVWGDPNFESERVCFL